MGTYDRPSCSARGSAIRLRGGRLRTLPGHQIRGGRRPSGSWDGGVAIRMFWSIRWSETISAMLRGSRSTLWRRQVAASTFCWRLLGTSGAFARPRRVMAPPCGFIRPGERVSGTCPSCTRFPMGSSYSGRGRRRPGCLLRRAGAVAHRCRVLRR